MDGILKILKKENGPRASSAPALELNTIIFKHVYWYMQQISGERLQDHWSSGFRSLDPLDKFAQELEKRDKKPVSKRSRSRSWTPRSPRYRSR